jgi:hypothetical protein
MHFQVHCSDFYVIHFLCNRNYFQVSKWISATVLTTITSFFVSCALEAPIIGIEKIFLHPASTAANHNNNIKSNAKIVPIDDKPLVVKM